MKHDSIKRMTVASYIAYSCLYLCRLNLSIASPTLKETGVLGESELGILSGLFLGAYAFGKLCFGGLGDRLPARLIIGAGLFGSAFCNLAFAAFPPVWVLGVLWCLNGLCQSLVWGPMLKAVSNRIEKSRAKKVVAVLVTSVGFGSVLGIGVGSLSIGLTHKAAAAFYIPGVILLIAAVIDVLFTKSDNSEKAAPPVPVKELWKDKAFLSMTLPAFLHGIIKDNINVWMCLFFAVTYGLDLKNLTFYVFLIPVLTLIGRLLFLPLLNLFHGNEKAVAFFALFITGISQAVLALFPLPAWGALICFALTASLVSMANTTLLSIFPLHFEDRGCVSAVASYMDVMSYCGAAIGSFVYGSVVTHFGYPVMFASWAIFAFAAAFLLAYRKNKYK